MAVSESEFQDGAVLISNHVQDPRIPKQPTPNGDRDVSASPADSLRHPRTYSGIELKIPAYDPPGTGAIHCLLHMLLLEELGVGLRKHESPIERFCRGRQALKRDLVLPSPAWPGAVDSPCVSQG